ncbi:hypothetical protein [Mucilaginibacter sp.]|uniref:hypothetical protein n=1 Tax=Mucilaginibacter sp. TaxID=1882438 RepID=UPI003D110CB6
MKKASILTIAAFYLLLTTGMFVCIVHCAAESLVSKPAMSMQMMHTAGMGHQHKKHCTNGGDCGCCKNHGTYTIKENLKPGTDFQFTQTTALIPRFEAVNFLIKTKLYTNNSWEDSNAPPGKSGRALLIQHCSFLI